MREFSNSRRGKLAKKIIGIHTLAGALRVTNSHWDTYSTDSTDTVARTGSDRLVPTIGLLLALGAAPALLVPACAAAGRSFAGADVRDTPVRQIVARLSPALVPLGFSMWLAHFGFHLWTGFATLPAASDRALAGIGLAASRPFSSSTVASP